MKKENGENIVFEIKSRAVAPMRYDLENYQYYTDYSIKSTLGLVESHEREYYDIIRGAMLKYSF